MQNFGGKVISRFLSLSVLAVLLSACAASVPKPDDVSVRAQARWDTFFAGDLNGAYMYFSPGYRSSVSSLQYQRKVLTQKVIWTAADYIDSDCLENTCKVRISLKFSIVGALPGVPRYDGTKIIEESWIRSEGQWWFVPEK